MASRPPMPIVAWKSCTAGWYSTGNGAFENATSQCRRGTPKMPWKIIDMARTTMPMPKR
jgi:hypothetical protein